MSRCFHGFWDLKAQSQPLCWSALLAPALAGSCMLDHQRKTSGFHIQLLPQLSHQTLSLAWMNFQQFRFGTIGASLTVGFRAPPLVLRGYMKKLSSRGLSMLMPVCVLWLAHVAVLARGHFQLLLGALPKLDFVFRGLHLLCQKRQALT